MNISIKLSLPQLSPRGMKMKKKPKDVDKAMRIDVKDMENAVMPEGMDYYSYEVQKDETVADIAEKFDMNPVDLSKFLIDKEGKDTLYEGQEIDIPVYLVKKE